MAISEQARRCNEFFEDILQFFVDELIKNSMDAELASKKAEDIALKLHERWQSHTLVFPKKPQLVFDRQKQEVLAAFTGNNMSELVRTYGYSETIIYKWMREERAALKQKLKDQEAQKGQLGFIID